MEAKYSCPHCNQHVVLDAPIPGVAISCPNCNVSFALPETAKDRRGLGSPWIWCVGALLAIAITYPLLFRSAPSTTKSDTKIETKNSRTSGAWIQLGTTSDPHGLSPAFTHSDGATRADSAGGRECHSLVPRRGKPDMYAYFKLDSAVKARISKNVMIEVEYFDSDKGEQIQIQYDSFDPAGKKNGAYTASKESLSMDGSQEWRTVRFSIGNARFDGRQNGGADFRVAVHGNRFYLGKVTINPI